MLGRLGLDTAILDIPFERPDSGYHLAAETEDWLGEGEAWSRMAVPMLSFTGAGLDFHTPNDTAARATSPQALARVADPISAAITLLHQHGEST